MLADTVWDVSSLQVAVISVPSFSHLHRHLLHFIFRLYLNLTVLMYSYILC